MEPVQIHKDLTIVIVQQEYRDNIVTKVSQDNNTVNMFSQNNNTVNKVSENNSEQKVGKCFIYIN
jgi:hypothetical protein